MNVVENKSKVFGVSPWWEYIKNIKNHITVNEELFPIHIFVLCLFTVYHCKGRLPGEKGKYFPYLFIFIVTNLAMLSLIEHKENRFMVMILPLFAIFWAFFAQLVIEFAKSLNTLSNKRHEYLPNLAKMMIYICLWWYMYTEFEELSNNHMNSRM